MCALALGRPANPQSDSKPSHPGFVSVAGSLFQQGLAFQPTCPCSHKCVEPRDLCLPVVFFLSHCSMSLSENLQTPLFLVVSLIAGMILFLAHLRMVSGLTCSRLATCFTVSFCDVVLFNLARFVPNVFVWPESFGLTKRVWMRCRESAQITRVSTCEDACKSRECECRNRLLSLVSCSVKSAANLAFHNLTRDQQMERKAAARKNSDRCWHSNSILCCLNSNNFVIEFFG